MTFFDTINWDKFDFDKIETSINNPKKHFKLGEIEIGLIKFNFELVNERMFFQTSIKDDEIRPMYAQIGTIKKRDILLLGEFDFKIKILEEVLKWCKNRPLNISNSLDKKGLTSHRYYLYEDLINNKKQEYAIKYSCISGLEI